jgi:hypothetical protein
MIKLKDILNESDIKWSTLDKIIKAAKYDPATGKKILKWAANTPAHNPYIHRQQAHIKDPSTSYWREELKFLNSLGNGEWRKKEDGSVRDMRKALKADPWGLNKQFVYNDRRENKIILAYWFSTTRWSK